MSFSAKILCVGTRPPLCLLLERSHVASDRDKPRRITKFLLCISTSWAMASNDYTVNGNRKCIPWYCGYAWSAGRRFLLHSVTLDRPRRLQARNVFEVIRSCIDACLESIYMKFGSLQFIRYGGYIGSGLKGICHDEVAIFRHHDRSNATTKCTQGHTCIPQTDLQYDTNMSKVCHEQDWKAP